MAKNSVLGHPSNTPNLAREGFNLDQYFTFTASTGMLLPVWYDILNPGETIKGAPNFLLRSDNFLAPAMADVDCFVDLFFVPFRKLFSSFGEWIYQIDDIRSDLFDFTKYSAYLPYLNDQLAGQGENPFSHFDKAAFDSLATPDALSRYSRQRFDSTGFGMHRLFSHLGLNPQAIFAKLFNEIGGDTDWRQPVSILPEFAGVGFDVSCPSFSPYLLAAYQGIYYDYYRNSEFEPNNIKAYNFDSYMNQSQPEIDVATIEWNSHLNSRRGLFELRYRWRSKDYFTASRSTPLINNVSMMPNYANNLTKVNQWLTSGSYSFMGNDNLESVEDAFTNVGISLGGDGSFELTGNPSANLEDFSLGDPIYSNSPSSMDVPNGTLPTGLYGIGKFNAGTQLSTNSDPSVYVRVKQEHTHGVGEGSSINVSRGDMAVSGSVDAVLSTARLRTMFALEKLARITQRAGKHYDDQTLAHFGFKVPQYLSGEVVKIKGWHTMLGIQKVTSTAATQEASLGEQAAVGFGILDGSKNRFKFTAKEHGIVMAIWSCAPRYKYLVSHDKLAYKTTLWDFYKPALDNLGSQPLFGYELSSAGLKRPSDIFDTTVFDWQWRFMESKVKFSHVTPVFSTNAKNPWSMVGLTETFTYDGRVSPCDLNLLFNTQYNPAPDWPAENEGSNDYFTDYYDFAKNYLRDPFTIDFFMKCTKVSTMSTFGDTPLNGI